MRCRGCQKPLSRCVVCSLYMNFDPPKSAITNENGRLESKSFNNKLKIY
jgi:hypothetical protein